MSGKADLGSFKGDHVYIFLSVCMFLIHIVPRAHFDAACTWQSFKIPVSKFGPWGITTDTFTWFFIFVMWRHARKSRKTQARCKVGASVSMHFLNLWCKPHTLYVYRLYHQSFSEYAFCFPQCSGFRICQSSRLKTEKLNCISRASCAQGKKCSWVK